MMSGETLYWVMGSVVKVDFDILPVNYYSHDTEYCLCQITSKFNVQVVYD